ncbi:hypothetical protein NQ314_011048 [Rhamnusium bicolor]|uniref:Uncharacterized protein n=1 Tax=Rhamnusium bicolor TaxID=1586634 RepID=A0AAV8XM91_9CUCU|nr:hypothetical protein NQ314_011048 [Rhamnusium bicolor]
MSFLPKYNQCDVPPFNIERNAFTVQNHWNRAVEIVFSGIAGFPYNVIGMFEKEVKEVPKCESSGDSLTIENKYKD